MDGSPPLLTGKVKIHYDAEVDAAYIYLISDEEAQGAVLRQTIVKKSPPNSEIIFDVENGRTLHGIEILGASFCLPESLIKRLRVPE
ncbi:uncharacterized protein YuzE [Kibdelosporangium banguiense]|uniref:Uncharacterized protein YuzE n=1 Tax=Kibdelosporangium banguiense TaxID=1365924 RepID=A0ABS4TM43_9PSEU|nr:DUF2283 domain-containing protein [Kibdelosporangium banguiense]MBP2325461.1 uncharacterized protein YuzE [Kibdelosporangium banguiense]